MSIAQRTDRCRVLGPGNRAVVWVQGCPLRCRDCVAAEMLPFEGGELWPVTDLADWLLQLPDIDGVTFSGGEPMAHAGPLAELVDRVRASRDLSVLCYTGFTIERLRRSGSVDQHDLMSRVDILIDGPYRPEFHADLLWRGSRNQRIHYLTARHAPVAGADQHSAGLEIEVSRDGTIRWTGVPAVPGFRAMFEAGLSARGVRLHIGR